jgi:hypothetical protein
LAGRRAIFFWPNAYRLSSSGSRHAKTENIGDEAQSGDGSKKRQVQINAARAKRVAAGGDERKRSYPNRLRDASHSSAAR